jgi:uncharacterized protein YutE (UPF0331/DUF86 family)
MPIELDDIIINKAGIIERSLRRVIEEYQADPALDSYTHIDALTLNLERACQAAIDIAIHICSIQRLGIPQTSTDAFKLLEKAGILHKETTKKMIGMVGFRNIAVHEYQVMDMNILRAIAEQDWKSLVDYLAQLGVHIQP